MHQPAIQLYDFECKDALYPLAQLNHVAHLPAGIMSIKQKWEFYTGQKIILNHIKTQEPGLVAIPANIVPNQNNYREVIQFFSNYQHGTHQFPAICRPWQVLQFLKTGIIEDAKVLPWSKTDNQVPLFHTGKEALLIHPAAQVQQAFINTVEGPVIIDEGATIQQGSMLQGPLYVGKKSIIKMGATIYGPVYIGNHCVVGGEVKNSAIMQYSNKAHAGYLGDSVIGPWCNLGAGTSCSNIKNTASNVGYASITGQVINTGNLKGGLLMGDYSKAAINTAFNTGCVVGVGCNIYTPGLTEKHYPNFSFGADRYMLDKFIAHTKQWKNLHGHELTPFDIEMITNLYNR